MGRITYMLTMGFFSPAVRCQCLWNSIGKPVSVHPCPGFTISDLCRWANYRKTYSIESLNTFSLIGFPPIWYLKCVCKHSSAVGSDTQFLPDSIKDKAPLILPILSSIHAHLPMLLSVMCHHWCFPFHLDFHPFKLLFHTNAFQRRFITAVLLVMPFISITWQKKHPPTYCFYNRQQTWVKHL